MTRIPAGAKCAQCGAPLKDGKCDKCLAQPLKPLRLAQQLKPLPQPLVHRFITSPFKSELKERQWSCAICDGKITYSVNELDEYRLLPMTFLDSFQKQSSSVTRKLDSAKENMNKATDGKERVKWQVVSQIYSTGSFEVNGIIAFWEKFKDSLCKSCEDKLRQMAELRGGAIQLLEKAVQLDPTNQVVAKNLKGLK